jgi:hypothetical protein
MQAAGLEEMPGYGLNHPSPRDKAYMKPGKGSKLPSVGHLEKWTPRQWQGGSSREFGKELTRQQHTGLNSRESRQISSTMMQCTLTSLTIG